MHNAQLQLGYGALPVVIDLNPATASMASSARLSSSREIIGLASGQDAVGYQLEITFQLQLVVAAPDARTRCLSRKRSLARRHVWFRRDKDLK